MAEIYEDSPPMQPPPKGLLSAEGPQSMGLISEMQPEGEEHSDEETTHAGAMMEAFKSGDVDALRDATKAMIKACIRDYNKSPSK
jgi:DNA-binding GntR family transcriptional regulator